MNVGQFRRVLRQAFTVPVFALIVLAGVLLWQVTAAQRAQQWVDHSDQVSAASAELERMISDQETSLRGYQLTGDAAMLASYNAADAQIQAQFDDIRRLVADNAEQEANLARVRGSYQVWLDFANNVLTSPANAGNAALNHRGKDLMDMVRAGIRTFSRTEEHLRKERFQSAIALERRNLAVTIVGAVLVGVVLGLSSFSRLRKVSQAFQESMDELQQRSVELYESREWLHTALHSIGDAVIVCDVDSNIELMNPVAERLTKWPMSDAKGKPLQQVFHIINEQTREEAENPVEKVRRLNTVIGLANHTALIARDGTEYVIDDSAAPIRDKNGAMVGIILVFRDVTDQRRAEAALIANEKLALAGRLAASIAHEIHNPLDSVANLIYLLGRENDPQKRSEYLAMADQELRRTMQISRTMLNLYREPNAPVGVNLQELLDGVLLLLQRRLDLQSIHVQRDFGGKFEVEGFPAELRQVFANLITNAVDATGNGGKLAIRMRGVPAEEFRGAGVIIEVLDNGPGISEQASQKIFQPFFTTKGEHGTGLGLWVSMGIVQKHGGSIRIENSDDPEYKGARVRVYLPARTLATPASRATVHLSQG